MDKFLGLPIVRKPLTDSQCVERARKNIERFRRYGAWLIPFHIVPLIAFAIFIDSIVKILWQLGVNRGGLLGGVAIGIALGLPVGAAIFYFVEYFGQVIGFFKADHTSELLVKYHDMLTELARAEDESASNETEQGRAGGSG